MRKPLQDKAGILVKLSFIPISRELAKIFVGVYVGTKSQRDAGDAFYPSRHAEEYLRKPGAKVGLIGNLELEVDRNARELIWKNYHPFGEGSNFIEELEGKGIASVIDAAIMSRLKRAFPRFVVLDPDPSGSKMQFLEKARIELGKAKIEEYYRKRRDYLRSMFKRFPPKGSKRKPKP